MFQHGRRYARDSIDTAMALGQSLALEGFGVVDKPPVFTHPHMVALDARPFDLVEGPSVSF
jgi:hypothetical protein